MTRLAGGEFIGKPTPRVVRFLSLYNVIAAWVSSTGVFFSSFDPLAGTLLAFLDLRSRDSISRPPVVSCRAPRDRLGRRFVLVSSRRHGCCQRTHRAIAHPIKTSDGVWSPALLSRHCAFAQAPPSAENGPERCSCRWNMEPSTTGAGMRPLAQLCPSGLRHDSWDRRDCGADKPSCRSGNLRNVGMAAFRFGLASCWSASGCGCAVGLRRHHPPFFSNESGSRQPTRLSRSYMNICGPWLTGMGARVGPDVYYGRCDGIYNLPM